jgi:hypothetical protein
VNAVWIKNPRPVFKFYGRPGGLVKEHGANMKAFFSTGPAIPGMT